MTATTASFTSLPDFLTKAAPGDYYTEPPAPADRSITTYRLLERSDNPGDGRGGHVEHITTRHYGRAEIAGRPEYAYITSVFTHRTHYRHPSICTVFSMGGKAGRYGDVIEAQRHSRRKLNDVHRQHVADYLAEFPVD